MFDELKKTLFGKSFFRAFLMLIFFGLIPSLTWAQTISHIIGITLMDVCTRPIQLTLTRGHLSYWVADKGCVAKTA